MNKGNEKKKWARPKLIVLVRGKSEEERVLVACKGGNVTNYENLTWGWNCFKWGEPVGGIFCHGCYVTSRS